MAHRLSPDWGTQGRRALSKSFVLWLVAAAASFAFFLGFYSSPSLIPWPLAMLFGPLLIFIITRFITDYDWHEKPNDMHTFALCSGALAFFIVFATLQELGKTR